MRFVRNAVCEKAKFDCLINEMLCIQYLKPALNVQSDSLRARVFM